MLYDIETLIEKRRERQKNQAITKVECVCGVSYSKSNKTNHGRTQKHMDYIRSLVPTINNNNITVNGNSATINTAPQ